MQRPAGVRSTMRAIDECECLDCWCDHLARQTKQCIGYTFTFAEAIEALDSSLCRAASELLQKDVLFI